MILNEKNFCIGPWSEIRILADGTLNWCHCARYDTSQDNIKDIDLDSYFNGVSVNTVRDQLLQGKDVTECQQCYDDESKVVFTFRRRRNIQMAVFPLEHFEKSIAESNIQKRFHRPDLKPYFYNIVLGNVCNLACLMCFPQFSTRLVTDLKRMQLLSADYPGLLDWTQDPRSWKKFVDHIDSNPDIVCVHFQGGEPLLHPRFREFLQHCVDTGHTNFHLTMVTNGTVFDQDLIDLFRHFQSCQIEISIESMTQVNEYIRYPVRQQEQVKNIKRFLACCDRQLSVVLRTVPQLLSVPDYVSVLEFALEHNVCIDSNIIDHPEYLKPAVWPNHVCEKIIARLENFKTKLCVDHTQIHLNLRNTNHIKLNLKQNTDMVIASLKETLVNKKQLQMQAQAYIEKIDHLRKIQIQDYCLEFASIYE